MTAHRSISLDELLPLLRCPRTAARLVRANGALVAEGSDNRYPLLGDVPDLLVPPTRLTLDLPWIEPWDDLDALRLDRPEPLAVTDLPYHLDAYVASVAGERGDGRSILEVGCGERKCEDYFLPRGFRYVGTDADSRGRGPHLRADAHNLPFVDASFDLYLSLAVYEHLASPLVAAREGFRVLRPGGVFFGTAAFVYGFHDRASFNHMTHAGLLWTLRMAGFEGVRIWPDWDYPSSVSEMGFGPGLEGMPWRVLTRGFLKVMDGSFTRTNALARRVAGKKPLDVTARAAHTAGSLSFVAYKSAVAG